jgi:hypothetical protein
MCLRFLDGVNNGARSMVSICWRGLFKETLS